MKDILQDIVAHTHSLGVLQLIKINTDTNTTKIVAVADDRRVLLLGETHERVAEFEGTFGMGHLEKLSFLLKNPEYQEDAKLEVMKEQDENGNEYLSYLHFENLLGDFQNDYRFINHVIIDNKIADYKFNGAAWELEFEPTITSISRLKLMATTHSEETTFRIHSDNNNNVIFKFGDEGTHAGEFIFKHNCDKKLKHERLYPIASVMSVLVLSGDKFMRISSTDGALEITVDSGLATYQYIIPIYTK